MARINSSFFAGLSGKISNVVISSWRGIPVLKSAPTRRRKPRATQAQLIQREKLKVASAFLKMFGDIIKFGFEPLEGQSARSQAQQMAMRHAIVGVYPKFNIDNERVLITRGSLEPASEVGVSSNTPGEILFHWKNKSDSNSDVNDKCIMIVLHDKYDHAVHNLDGSPRHKEASSFVIPFLAGKKVYCWMAFRSPDGMLKSNSVYAGELTVCK